MKYGYTICLLLLATNNFSQTSDTLRHSKVSFIAVVDSSRLTKDGIYLDDYIVNMPYEKVKQLHGKKIKVTGEITILKGLKNTPKMYDKAGNEVIRGGREEDAKYIEHPKIEIIRD